LNMGPSIRQDVRDSTAEDFVRLLPENFRVSVVHEEVLVLIADHHEADLRDTGALQAAVDRAQPDVVFHLAAQSLVRESYRAPRETFDVNVLGTVLVEVAVEVDVEVDVSVGVAVPVEVKVTVGVELRVVVAVGLRIDAA